MKSIAQQYTDTMRKKYGKVYAAWKPGSHFELGDYGFLEKGVFSQLGNVKQLGDEFKFKIIEDPKPSNEEYRSEAVKKNKITADGKTVANSNVNVAAGFSIEFANAGSVLYEAKNVRTNKIADVAALGAKIKKLYFSGKSAENGVFWDKRYVVITEIDEAESATIIVANTKNTKVNLLARANISAARLDIADAKLGWEHHVESGEITKSISDNGATPLFKLMGVELKRKDRKKYTIEPSSVSSDLAENADFVAIENCENWIGEEVLMA